MSLRWSDSSSPRLCSCSLIDEAKRWCRPQRRYQPVCGQWCSRVPWLKVRSRRSSWRQSSEQVWLSGGCDSRVG